jgi:L-malate glycosyltransferase
VPDRDTLSILHVDSETTWRGGQEALLSLAKELRKRGHGQTIACPARSELLEVAKAEGFPVVPLGGSRELRRALWQHRFGLMHAHSGRAHNMAFLAGIGISVARVVTRHVTFAPTHPLVHKLKYTRTCDGIIAVSEPVRRVLARAGVPLSKVEVIHTGVFFPPKLPSALERAVARRLLNLDEGRFIIGQIGAFTHEKGQDVAIDAVVSLSAELPGIQLVLAGEGKLLASLRAKASGAPVSFPGFVDDRPSFYAALDLLIMPSRSEAWGLAALEAMAQGVPVIASNTGGLAEIIQDGVNGRLVPSGDAQALAEAIRRAAIRGDERERWIQRGRDRAAEFSIAKTAEQTEAFYRRIRRPQKRSAWHKLTRSSYSPSQ